MDQMVLGFFNSESHAQEALSELTTRGFNTKDISIIAKEGVIQTDVDSSTGSGRVASGATTGGIVGALAGLLIGIGAIAVPGIGGLLIGGPIAAALGLTGAAASTVSGAVTGVLAGGLVGALTTLGIPEEKARRYESQIQSGSILLMVPIRTVEDEDTVRDIMDSHGATQIDTVDTQTTR